MIPAFINKTNIPLLNKALDAYSLRQQVSAENLANIGSPSYKTKRVSFEDQLSSSMNFSIEVARTHENHIPIGQSNRESIEPKVYEESSGNPIASGVNDVDIDLEMSELAKTQISYKFSTRMVTDIFRSLQKSIKGQL